MGQRGAADLAGVLTGLVREEPLLSPALRIDVVAQAVDGLKPGIWRFDPVRRALLPRRAPRPGPPRWTKT